jgi:2-polyprenyl-3-methyl-5-hydroxy-6-metoxy-1,4-benzoquinol methylase
MKDMVEEIRTTAERATYDFRETAYPEDPLRYLFPDWVPYYRMKWATARVLRPESILEIGVRFGYSALAFLNAAHSARYVGIDLDLPTFGGSVGAINWARKACSQYRAEFVIADSTKMERFPGGRYDLIHVDGQQDVSGTMHDLILAAHQAKYILLDGYFWSRSNLFSASDFLYRYRDVIECSHVIPGYAGELLIKLKVQDTPTAITETERNFVSSSGHTRDCYLYDEKYRHAGGVEAENICLETMAKLARAVSVDRALDIRCGGGELSIKLAERGFNVTAIDDSQNAIRVARERIGGVQHSSPLISLQSSEINAAELRGQYGVAVAVDLIEHMKPVELDGLYQRIAKHLSRDGLFIVHSYPNLWYYKYEHRRKLRIARRIGAYLPTEPRTRHELIMHVNEQSPRALRRQLSKYFPHVLVWFGSPERCTENLARRFSTSEMRSAPDLFAVASHSSISVAKLLAQFRMEPVRDLDLKQLELTVRSYPAMMQTMSPYTVSVELRNGGSVDLKSADPYPIHLSYHWLGTNGQYVIFDGERTRLMPDARSGSSVLYEMNVIAPNSPGTYFLRVTLVQERIKWFDQASESLCRQLQIVCTDKLECVAGVSRV